METSAVRYSFDELSEAWPGLGGDERITAFRALPREEAAEFFLSRSARSQAELLQAVPPGERRGLMRSLAPDDAADVLQELPTEERAGWMSLLDDRTRKEVAALVAYKEDEAGGLMNPRFVRVRPEMTVDEAMAYVLLQSRERPETIYYVYVLDGDQRLLGILSFRELFTAPGGAIMRDIMAQDLVTVGEHEDQERVAELIARHDILALPVVDAEGRMRGIVTVDDVVDVVQSEATEDIQKIGGSTALDKPYLQTSVGGMVRKRAPWLAVLFIGEMLTVSAIGLFETELTTVVVLAFFIPLIIASGGNSGSQATTLVIRALALGELRLRDWWRVARRELLTGVVLGAILASLGVARIFIWDSAFGAYGEHTALLSITIGLAVIAVVTWGTLVGSALPFLLERLGADPAAASAPLVATLVDVTGILIYFSVAAAVLSGTVL